MFAIAKVYMHGLYEVLETLHGAQETLDSSLQALIEEPLDKLANMLPMAASLSCDRLRRDSHAIRCVAKGGAGCPETRDSIPSFPAENMHHIETFDTEMKGAIQMCDGDAGHMVCAGSFKYLQIIRGNRRTVLAYAGDQESHPEDADSHG